MVELAVVGRLRLPAWEALEGEVILYEGKQGSREREWVEWEAGLGVDVGSISVLPVVAVSRYRRFIVLAEVSDGWES